MWFICNDDPVRQSAIGLELLVFFMYVLHSEPVAAVNDCWAQGAVPKVIVPRSKSVLQQDVDVLGGGDASIAAASPRPVGQLQSVFPNCPFFIINANRHFIGQFLRSPGLAHDPKALQTNCSSILCRPDDLRDAVPAVSNHRY